MAEEPQKWLVLNEDSCVIIVPDYDSKPHGFPKNEEEVELAGLDCPCKPKILHNGEKPVIIHNSFLDQERIDKSLNNYDRIS